MTIHIPVWMLWAVGVVLGAIVFGISGYVIITAWAWRRFNPFGW